jgi:methylamine dehydrogenase accessory protein MauD
MNLIVACLVLLWLVVIGLALLVLALARQIGVLHERLAPVGALTVGGGPQVGDTAPLVMAERLDGSLLQVGGRPASGAMSLLLFVSADCPVCKKIIPLAKAVARADRLDLVFVGDDDRPAQEDLISRFGLQAYPFVNGPQVGMAYAVGKLPYAVLVDEAGRIAAKGLVNNREHLESLLVSKTSGFPSLQSYLGARSAAAQVGSA